MIILIITTRGCLLLADQRDQRMGGRTPGHRTSSGSQWSQAPSQMSRTSSFLLWRRTSYTVWHTVRIRVWHLYKHVSQSQCSLKPTQQRASRESAALEGRKRASGSNTFGSQIRCGGRSGFFPVSWVLWQHSDYYWLEQSWFFCLLQKKHFRKGEFGNWKYWSLILCIEPDTGKKQRKFTTGKIFGHEDTT